MRPATSHCQLWWPMKAWTNMVVITTTSRKAVPQRGWRRLKVRMCSGVRVTRCSKAWIVMCSAPW